MAIDDPAIGTGCVIQGQILITSYFDEKGRMKYAVGTNGGMNIAQVLGLMVLGGKTIYEMYEQDEPYEADEMEEDND